MRAPLEDGALFLLVEDVEMPQFPRSRNRPTRNWIGGPFALTSLTATQSILAQITVGEAETIVRIRGFYLIKAIPDAATDDEVVGLGLIVVSDQAAAAGGTSVPGPIATIGVQWLWHNYVPLNAGQAALSGADLGSMVRGVIDSKAMRKMGPNDSLVLIGELSTGLYSAVEVNGGFRVLI